MFQTIPPPPRLRCEYVLRSRHEPEIFPFLLNPFLALSLFSFFLLVSNSCLYFLLPFSSEGSMATFFPLAFANPFPQLRFDSAIFFPTPCVVSSPAGDLAFFPPLGAKPQGDFQCGSPLSARGCPASPPPSPKGLPTPPRSFPYEIAAPGASPPPCYFPRTR